MKCFAVRPPKRESCGEPATHLITFSDGDMVTVCETCALYLQEVALKGHGVRIRVDSLAHAAVRSAS